MESLGVRTADLAAAELIESIARIHARGWCDATSGNFSVVVRRDPLRLLVTPSGVPKETITAAELLAIDGERRSRFTRAPSAELPLHLVIARHALANAVLHTHSVWGTLLGERFVRAGGLRLRGYEMLKAFDGIDTHRAELFVPVFANSQNMRALAARVRTLLGKRPEVRGFLIAGHGLYAWGRTVAEARRHVEAFEFLFEVLGRRVPLEPYAG